ncbi:MAG: DUF6807 domain-containing protein [Chitinophagaceae bacterium]
MRKLLLLFILPGFSFIASSQQSKGFTITEKPAKKQVDILFNDKLLTAYCYYDSSRKPFLFPVNTIDGITVTRGYPFQPVAGERTDHPHHTGIWLNYESVNGLDFWNNSTAIAPGKRHRYGTIVHQEIVDKKTNGNTASLVTTANWIRPDGKILLNERSAFNFTVQDNNFIIDRVSTLTAADTKVDFKDVKDGMFAIRVARELELPSKESSDYVDDKGNITKVPASGNNVTGMYYSSTGLTGDSVWSSKGRWTILAGKKQGRDITIGIIDHPANVGYPGYWHARGYGLFAINPLGRKVFSNGKEELNFSLAPDQSTTFRYRTVIHSGAVLTREQMNKLGDDFEKVK